MNFKDMFSHIQIIGPMKSKVRKLIWQLGKEAFSFVLILILLEVIFAEFLFYKYVIAVDIDGPMTAEATVGFQKKAYESILQEWQEREEFLKNAQQEKYTSPFQ